MVVQLPISKSIAQRVLIRQAMLGLPLAEVHAGVDPDDVVLLRSSLDAIAAAEGPLRLDLRNCGTAMRFLSAYCAQRPGTDLILDGCERMRERPIAPLVDALRSIGAQIDYTEQEGFPPLHIRGVELDRTRAVRTDSTMSTQFASALLLIGLAVENLPQSPYIELTQAIIRQIPDEIERDWSAAAFWLERWAIGLCEQPEFPGLNPNSLQGDRVGLSIFSAIRTMERGATMEQDFTACPDLYPAVAIACRQRGITLRATGVERLRHKESDRLRAIEESRTYGDHRIAMALLAADLPCDDTACISKSYPLFLLQLRGTMLIGIAGGIGSGKSTLCAEIRRRGHAVYDCDSRAKELIATSPQLREAICGLLGQDAYRDGRYDTAYVAGRIFSDPSLLRRLNAIVHPAVAEDLRQWAAEYELCYVESAILHSAGIAALCNTVVFVDAPEEIRLQRVLQRNATSAEEVRARMRQQKTDDAKLMSDIVLLNDGQTPIAALVDSLERHIQALHAVR